MKLAWKNNNKKRPLATVSKFPNLPFDHKNDNLSTQTDTSNEPNADQNDTELNKVQHHEPNNPSVSEEEEADEDVTKLFNSFQSQGTKLAEVVYCPNLCSFLLNLI